MMPVSFMVTKRLGTVTGRPRDVKGIVRNSEEKLQVEALPQRIASLDFEPGWLVHDDSSCRKN